MIMIILSYMVQMLLDYDMSYMVQLLLLVAVSLSTHCYYWLPLKHTQNNQRK